MTKKHGEDADCVSFDDVVVKRQGELSITCIIHDEQMVIPVSQIGDDSEIYVKKDGSLSTSSGTLSIKKWLAKKLGAYEE